MSKKQRKVAVGLSGGVDSAVTAYLLKKQGYEVTGVYVTCFDKVGCRATQDRKDAMRTALELGIKFENLNFVKEYKNQVLDYFFEEYKRGRTPNPDVLCNSVIKFGLFYDWAMKKGFDYVATGHYAKIQNVECRIQNAEGRKNKLKEEELGLFAAKDGKKDQSYFLYQIKKEQLSNIIFPLGDLLKTRVREIAKEQRLSVAQKKDSMGICFVGDINVNQFLKEKFGVRKGKVKLADGTIIGEHDGYYLFNIGHRGGWRRLEKIDDGKYKGDGLPKLYVTQINREENEIIVGEREECMKKEFFVSKLNLFDDDFSRDIFVKIRNTGDFLKTKIKKVSKERLKVGLEKQEFGISSGQSTVIYKRESKEYRLLGGGVIE